MLHFVYNYLPGIILGCLAFYFYRVAVKKRMQKQAIKRISDNASGWYDIMDPRGDGQLKAGDEMYDAMNKAARRDNAVMGEWVNGKWVLREIPLPEQKDEK